MLTALLLLLILFWLLGYISLPFIAIPDFVLFDFNGQPVSLWDIIILLLISWIIGVLPSPFRQIAGIFFFLWILSELGILLVAGMSSMLLMVIIIGLIVYLASGLS
jgi:hypothetical protein